MKTILTLMVACLLLWCSAVIADDFDQVKQKLGRSGCHYFEFYSIIESDIFDQVDTALGTACIASDGRYNITVADENYVFDLERTYTYSESSGQVIIEKVDPSMPVGEEIAFVLKLDETYKTVAGKKKDTFELYKRGTGAAAYPDSLYVEIDSGQKELKQFEYFDVNEELNRIVFKKYDFEAECDSTAFIPVYPDSAEVIRL